MSAVLDKIRAETPKKRGPLARGRVGNGSIDSNGAEKLTDLLRPHLSAAVRTWVAGLKATRVAWNGTLHEWQDTGFADWKERRECARAIVEYVVGKAIERTMGLTGNYKELSELIGELRASPEAQRLIGAGFFDSLLQSQPSGQSKAESADQAGAHEANDNLPPSQNTG